MDVAKDPWKPLVNAGWVALGLGVLDLLRFPYQLIFFDFPDTFASLFCAWALLKRRRSALLKTAIAGGVILGDAIVSVPLISRLLLRELGRPGELDHQVAGVVLSRLLLYALQVVAWPFLSVLVMRDQQSRGLPAAYADHTRDTIIGAFFISAWISGVTQLLMKTLIFRMV
jgi:hypothetical protein